MGRRCSWNEGRWQAPTSHSARLGLRSRRLSAGNPGQLNPDLRRAISRREVARDSSWIVQGGHFCPRKLGDKQKPAEFRRNPRASKKLRLNHFAAAQTGSTDAHVLVGRSHLGVNRPQVDVPAPLTNIVGVADSISELRPLAADITNSCHNSEVLPGLLPKH